MNDVYPVALKLAGKSCLVGGGGEIAGGKIDALLRSVALVTLVSPTVRPSIRDLATEGRIRLLNRPYQQSDLDGCFLVVAATDDRSANAKVAGDARAAGVLVNAVDDPPNCDFYAMALVRRGDLQVAISTNGLSPAFARWMRERLDGALPNEYGDLLALLSEVRQELRAHGPIPPYERWRAAIDDDLLGEVRCGAIELARTRLVQRLAGLGPSPAAGFGRAAATLSPTGLVSLVGAGPGDPGLITRAGLERLRAAEVVAHDRLVDRRLLAEAAIGAEIICVGKAPRQAGWSQAAINELLVERARAGKRVVRLKGGDPFVFGHGGDELAALVAAGVPVELIPGVSSAIAAPAAAGIPVTQRGLSSTLTIVTGHEDPGKPNQSVDWSWLARAPGTIVVLMGL